MDNIFEIENIGQYASINYHLLIEEQEEQRRRRKKLIWSLKHLII